MSQQLVAELLFDVCGADREPWYTVDDVDCEVAEDGHAVDELWPHRSSLLSQSARRSRREAKWYLGSLGFDDPTLSWGG